MASRYDRRRDKRRHSSAWVVGAIILAFWIVVQIAPALIGIGIAISFVVAMALLVNRLLLDTGASPAGKRDAINKLVDFVQRLSSPQAAYASNAQAVADEAMERAGRVLDENSIHLNDIGLLVYDDEKNPKIYRTSDVPTDALIGDGKRFALGRGPRDRDRRPGGPHGFVCHDSPPPARDGAPSSSVPGSDSAGVTPPPGPSGPPGPPWSS